MSAETVIRLPERSEVTESDTWDLPQLFADDAQWQIAFEALENQILGYEKFRGTLGNSAESLAACLEFDSVV